MYVLNHLDAYISIITRSKLQIGSLQAIPNSQLNARHSWTKQTVHWALSLYFVATNLNIRYFTIVCNLLAAFQLVVLNGRG